MKRFLGTVILLFLPAISLAGVRYEFEQVTSGEVHAGPSRVMGTVVIEGGHSRIDYGKESTVGGGNYVISQQPSGELIIVNPESEIWTRRQEADAGDDLQRLGVELSNLKVDMQELGAGPTIAGYPTRYYRLRSEYDISMTVGSITLEQHVEAVVDKWTTQTFGDVAPQFLGADPVSTGDAELDRLIEAETRRIPGFPLRQVSTIMTTLSDKNLSRSSQLKVDQSRTLRTEILVRKIGRFDAPLSYFQVPAGYQEIRPTFSDASGGVHMLSLQPNE